MGMITNCLTKLVRSGQITQASADAAQKLHDDMESGMGSSAGPLHSDAMAALEAARVMAENANKRKLVAISDASAAQRMGDYVNSHPQGPLAGAMGILTRDIHGKGTVNWDSSRQALRESLLGKAADFVKSYGSKWAGLQNDFVGAVNAVKELRGIDTGDQAAKQAAGAWKAAVDYGMDRAEKAGIFFRNENEKDQWRTPQFWDSARAKKFGQETFTKDMMDNFNSGKMRIIDKTTGNDVQGADIAHVIIKKAYSDIAINDGAAGMGAALNDNSRVFHFDDPQNYIDMMTKYGPGDRGFYGMMLNHLDGMARKVSAAEVMGPHWKQNFNAITNSDSFKDYVAHNYNKPGVAGIAQIPYESVENPVLLDRLFKQMSGQTDAPSNEMISGFFGAVRNMTRAAQLGSAVFMTGPSNAISTFLASSHLDIPATKVLGTVLKQIVDSGNARELASQLHVTAHNFMDNLGATKRFNDEFDPSARFGALSNFVNRATAHYQIPEMLKRAFSTEMYAHIAQNADKGLDDLPDGLKNFMSRNGFSSAEWDSLRQAKPIEFQGARYFDTEAVQDQTLAQRLASAVIDERRFAVLDGDARIHATLDGGLPKGTIVGELARSVGMYKNFPMSIMLTHSLRNFQGPQSVMNKSLNFALKTAFPFSLAGAISLQARSLINGQDPRDMTDPTFWRDAMLQGGVFGLYGDMIKQAQEGGTKNLVSSFLSGGPIGQLASDTGALTVDQYKNWSDGKDTNFGATMVKVARNWSPKLFYTKTAVDRLVWDNLQEQLDPNYQKSFQRKEDWLQQNTGQGYWWHPGDTSPQNGPSMGAALGQGNQ